MCVSLCVCKIMCVYGVYNYVCVCMVLKIVCGVCVRVCVFGGDDGSHACLTEAV